MPDDAGAIHSPARLVDPEAYDASEQQFAASLDSADGEAHTQESTTPRFVVEQEGAALAYPKIAGEEARLADSTSKPSNNAEARKETPVANPNPPIKTDAAKPEAGKPEQAEPSVPEQPFLPGHEDSPPWRQEVAARLDSYQSRHGAQEPRYPSLRLKFESELPAGKDSTAPDIASQPVFSEGAHSAAAAKRAPERPPETDPESPTRVIHFPRSAFAPPRPLEELAEPVLDRPRILEAPEVAPIPPALGGMLIETVEEPRRERRPGYEIPLSPASMRTRMFAAGLDLVLVTFAIALFGYIFFEMVDVTLSRTETAVAWLAFGIIFWVGYQFLFLVYTGSTPGLKLAGLQLARFDDTPASQRSRRWRALASMLSVLSLGLGYAWCFLDEDQLCWHDRITGTYLSPHSTEPAPPVC